MITLPFPFCSRGSVRHFMSHYSIFRNLNPYKKVGRADKKKRTNSI